MKLSNSPIGTLVKAALYCFYLFVTVFLLLEILLRIYNPLQLRIKGDKILLPVNQKLIITNAINPRLDKHIVLTLNSMGLRGPEMPPDFEHTLSIITVGGSTTACHFLNDNSTWPACLGRLLTADFRNVWLDNAGIDGHSTFGHLVLLQDHLIHIKPKVILFLTGINEIENAASTFHDKLYTKGAYPDFIHYLYNTSEVLNVAVNIFRGYRAQRFNNTTHQLKLPKPNNDLVLPEKYIAARIKNQEKFLAGYKERLNRLIDICRRNHIFPIFMTQPLLYGQGVDSLTRADLATTAVDKDFNGALIWHILELYNRQLTDVCAHNGVPVIDLASKMPKNSWYFYDATHYTNEGAALVAQLVAPDLRDILTRQFPGFSLHAEKRPPGPGKEQLRPVAP